MLKKPKDWLDLRAQKDLDIFGSDSNEHDRDRLYPYSSTLEGVRQRAPA